MNVLRDLLFEARGLVQDLGLLLSTLQHQRHGYVDWSGLASYTGTPVRTLRRIIPDHLKFRVTNRKVLFRIPEVNDFLEQYREPPGQDLHKIADAAVEALFNEEG